MATVKPIRVLANARTLIDLLADIGPLSIAEIADQTDIPRPSVYRLIDGLEAISLVESLPDARVQCSRRWLHLADASLAGMVEWRDAPRVLDGLVEHTGQTAFLSVPRANGAVCVGWAQGRGIGVLVLRPGRSLPYHAGAAGRALLAFGHEDVEGLLGQAPFARLTPYTLTTAEELRADVANTRERGYSVSDQDVTVGIGAVGVPVTDAAGRVRGSLSIGGLADEITARTEPFAAALLAAADDLGRSIPR